MRDAVVHTKYYNNRIGEALSRIAFDLNKRVWFCGYGYGVEEVAQVVSEHRPKLVVSGMNLPHGWTGIELARAVKAASPGTLFVLYSITLPHPRERRSRCEGGLVDMMLSPGLSPGVTANVTGHLEVAKLISFACQLDRNLGLNELRIALQAELVALRE